jgi:hypothetical protein
MKRGRYISKEDKSRGWSKKNTIAYNTKYTTTTGRGFIVTDHLGNSNYICLFEDYEVVADSRDIKSGIIQHPLDKTVYNRGYIGFGKFCATADRKVYSKWQGMFKRVYAGLPEYHRYVEYTVDKRWHNFQNFAKWAYAWEGCEGLDLDKDILCTILNKKEYSPETCLLLPSELNKVASHLPYTCVTKEGNKFRAKISTKLTGTIELGRYYSKNNALYTMTNSKAMYMLHLAEKYKLEDFVVESIEAFRLKQLQEVL